MVSSIYLIACVLAIGQLADRAEWQLTPRLATGMELVYSGTCVEEALGPNVNYQRRYRLDSTLFVLESAADHWDLAFMTSLRLREQATDPKASPQEQPSSVRLEIATLDSQGRLGGRAAALGMPISGPPTLECGMVIEASVAKVGRNQFWEVNDEGRPPRSWQVVGPELSGGVNCVKLIGNQQSDDWDRPRGDHTAWRRRDTIWLIPKLGIAQRVERTVERRLPARRDPTERTTLTYELDSPPLQYRGRLLDDRRQEILGAKKFQDDARPLLAQPSQHGPQIASLIRKMSYYMDNQAPSPYRKAVLSLQGRLESAGRGEAAPAAVVEEPMTSATVAIGQRVPDFIVTDLTGKESVRLARKLGRPVLLFFYNPTLDKGKEVLRFASALYQKHGDNLSIMAMAITDDPEIARKQHADWKLPFAVLDGKGLHATFGVDGTPRLIVLDGEGVLRYAGTGWGSQTPGEVTDELRRCLRK